MKRYWYSIRIPLLKPGEAYVGKAEFPTTHRPRKLVGKVIANPPQRAYYQRKTGGSRRKGKRASILFALAQLRHHKDTGDVTIDDIHVDGKTQMVGANGDAGIPIGFFAAHFSDNELMLDIGRVIRIRVTNREFARDIAGTMAVGCDGP